jgi:geranylgeranyl diphosphate synthase type II
MEKDFKKTFSEYKKKFDEHLSHFLLTETGKLPDYNGKEDKTDTENIYLNSLYEPVNYILSGGGKRVRPMIVMLVCSSLGGDIINSLDAAVALEILHNFTLVHDDIMDNALTRRGKETIHKKWDVNTAILVGDELIGLSYRSLLKTKSARINEILKVFTDGVVEVCEGQALDKEFELSNEVSIGNYLIMIRKKTAELLKTSALIGALLAEAETEDMDLISGYALNTGIAFQIQDDLLDVSANENEFGKKIGGDIIERKKTFLYLKALESASPEVKSELVEIYDSAGNETEKIKKVIEIYKKLFVMEEARKYVEYYTSKADEYLEKLGSESSSLLGNYSHLLLKRQF